MAHRVEVAPSGRSRCRACQRSIEKGALRLGVAVDNPFGEGEATHYYHLECGAWRQPDALLVAVSGSADSGSADSGSADSGSADSGSADSGSADSGTGEGGTDPKVLELLADDRRAALVSEAELSREHHRLRRFVKVERAKTARAHCRHCRETIEKGELRLCLEIIEDGRAGAAGFLHLGCARPYAGPVERTLPHIARSEEVSEQDFALVEKALAAG